MQTITAPKDVALNEYLQADEAGKAMLGRVFGLKTFVRITDRVNTFEEVCREIGTNPSDKRYHEGPDHEIADRMIEDLAKALNEGVIMSYANKNQKKWFPILEFVGSGFRFYVSDYDFAGTGTAGGSRHAFASEELANHAGRKFIDIYNRRMMTDNERADNTSNGF